MTCALTGGKHAAGSLGDQAAFHHWINPLAIICRVSARRQVAWLGYTKDTSIFSVAFQNLVDTPEPFAVIVNYLHHKVCQTLRP